MSIESNPGRWFISSPADKTPEATKSSIKSDIGKHLPRLPRWAAGWARTFLIGIAVALQNAGEYLLSVGLFLAACFSFISAVYHWIGIEDSPRLTRFSRVGGITLGVIFALAYLPWIVIRKGDRPWSNVTAAAPVKIVIPKPTQPPIPRNWDVKTESHPIAGEHVRRVVVPAKPSLRRTEQFLTNVMLYNSEQKIFCTGTMGSQMRQLSCGEMSNIYNGPIESKDVKSSLCVILQHYIVTIVHSAGQEWGSHGESTDAIYQSYFQPIDPPDVENYAARELLRIPDSNAPLFSYGLRFQWDLPRLRLPKGTEMSFVALPTEDQGPIAYGVRLERKGYYRIDLTVRARQQFTPGQTPAEYHIGKIGLDGQLKTLTFLVTADWEIQRSQDPSFVVEDYDAWAHQLANRVRVSLEN